MIYVSIHPCSFPVFLSEYITHDFNKIGLANRHQSVTHPAIFLLPDLDAAQLPTHPRAATRRFEVQGVAKLFFVASHIALYWNRFAVA